MSAIRLPLLCAFAGGCLSSAVLLGIWRANTSAAVPAAKQLSHPSESIASIVTKSAEQAKEISRDQPSPVAHAEPSIVEAEAVAPLPAGSAVSDVLMDLEAAYRRRLAGAPAEAPVALEHPAAPAPTNPALASVVPPAEMAAPAAVPVAAVTPTGAAVAIVPATVAPVAVAPVAVAAAEVPPPVAAAPALVAQADSRPPDVHIGDINNTYVTNVTNVRQGDVYLMQQQVAMMQYMQLLGMSGGYGAHTGVASPGAAHASRGTTAQFRQFPSTLTNLDNPWGFNFAPPNLVH